ncbi:MAG TPA: carbohydrate-binding family 9-like protein [Verrucomicrobiae bacterium]
MITKTIFALLSSVCVFASAALAARRHFRMRTTSLPIILAAFALGCANTKPPPVVAATALPGPALRASHLQEDFTLDGNTAKPVWRKVRPVRLELESRTAINRPDVTTSVRALWSEHFLYLAFDCPFTRLTVFEPVQAAERFGLWERDVVEAFIASDTNNVRRYTEYEVSPTNERLDVKIPEKDFAWSSGFESATRVDDKHRRWTAEMRIPWAALSETKPAAGARWRINLYRCDYANRAFLAFNPTLTGSFHTPERFGFLEFVE